jgi:hypothetical protein
MLEIKILKETGLVAMVVADSPTAEDIAWLDADLAPDLADDRYDWQEGELQAGAPVQFIPGVWIVVEADPLLNYVESNL